MDFFAWKEEFKQYSSWSYSWKWNLKKVHWEIQKAVDDQQFENGKKESPLRANLKLKLQ